MKRGSKIFAAPMYGGADMYEQVVPRSEGEHNPTPQEVRGFTDDIRGVLEFFAEQYMRQEQLQDEVPSSKAIAAPPSPPPSPSLETA